MPDEIESLTLAYSGGLDSSVLLHLFASVKCNVNVLHVNHNLNPNAVDWEAFCAEQAAQYGLSYRSVDIKIHATGHGIEAAAREKRYAVFAEHCPANSVLFTAHHADDQTETLLLRILRGTGIRGLCGMPIQRNIGQGLLLRPLLPFKRAELEAYATQHQLNYIVDASNFDTCFTRNYVRHDLMPQLSQQFVGIEKNLATLRANCEDANELLGEYTKMLYGMCKCEEKTQLNLGWFKNLKTVQQRAVLRYWLCNVNGLQAPSREQLLAFQGSFLSAKKDKAPQFKLGEFECRRYQQTLYLLPQVRITPEPGIQIWNPKQPIEGAEKLNLPAGSCLEVKYRVGGERFHPAGRIGSHPLKKLMQEWQIPPWERDRVPLLYYEGQLVCVIKYAVSNQYT